MKMKLANIAALGLLALASVSSALQCPVGSSLSTCTMSDVPSNSNCYSCYITQAGTTFSSYCDPTVTTGSIACINQKAVLQAAYSSYGGCTW